MQLNLYDTKQRNTQFDSFVESTWLEFPNTSKSCERELSYHQFYCKISFRLSLKKLSAALRIPVFIAGPHSEYYLVLNDLDNFGHYHPEFPIKMREYLIPAIRKTSFIPKTQVVYNTYLRDIARDFFVVYEKLNSDTNFYLREADRYKRLVEEKRLEPFYLDRFLYFLYSDFTDSSDLDEAAKLISFEEDQDRNPQIIKEIVGFWLRRKVDGTSAEFYLGLLDLMQIYDTDFLKKRTLR